MSRSTAHRPTRSPAPPDPAAAVPDFYKPETYRAEDSVGYLMRRIINDRGPGRDRRQLASPAARPIRSGCRCYKLHLGTGHHGGRTGARMPARHRRHDAPARPAGSQGPVPPRALAVRPPRGQHRTDRRGPRGRTPGARRCCAACRTSTSPASRTRSGSSSRATCAASSTTHRPSRPVERKMTRCLFLTPDVRASPSRSPPSLALACCWPAAPTWRHRLAGAAARRRIARPRLPSRQRAAPTRQAAAPSRRHRPTAGGAASATPQLDALVDAGARRATRTCQVAQARLARAQAAIDDRRTRPRGRRSTAQLDLTRQKFSGNYIYPAPLGGSIRKPARCSSTAAGRSTSSARTAPRSTPRSAAANAAAADADAARVCWPATWRAATSSGRACPTSSTWRGARWRSATKRCAWCATASPPAWTRGSNCARAKAACPRRASRSRRCSEQIAIAHTRSMRWSASPTPPQTLSPPTLAHRMRDRACSRASRPTCWAAAPTSPPRAGASRPRPATWPTRRTQFYPNINLVAFAGFSSIGFGNLLKSGSQQWGVGPALRLPIFEGGRLRANLRGKAADLDAAIESYNAAVLDAVRDVADQVAQRAVRRAPAGRAARRAGRRRGRLRHRRAALPRGPGQLPQRADGRDRRAGPAPPGGRPGGPRARHAGRPGARAGRRLAAADVAAADSMRGRPRSTVRTDTLNTIATRKSFAMDTTTTSTTPHQPPCAAPQHRHPPRPALADRNAKRRRALTALAAVVAGRRHRLGRLRMAGGQPLRVDRQRLRAGQRDPDHAADRRHGDGDHGRRHRLREGRPAAGAARPGRCARSRSTRPRPRWRRPCARCARCTPTTARWPRRCTLRQADIAQGAERRRPRAGRPEAPPGADRQRRGVEGRTQPRRDRSWPTRAARWPPRRPAWSPRASNSPATSR